MQRIELPAPELLMDGAPVACSTMLAYAGVYQLTLSSTRTALGVELHSSYLGHPDAPTSVLGHPFLAPDVSPRAWAREPAAHDMPVSVGRRRCLLDHLAVLQDAIAARCGDVQVTVDDRALDRVDAA